MINVLLDRKVGVLSALVEKMEVGMTYDNHIHIINEATTPPEVAAGRFAISKAEMKVIMGAAKVLRAVDWPDEIDAAASLVDTILGAIPRYRRIRELIALYFMSSEKQVALIRKMLRQNGVAGANVLIVPGASYWAITEILALCKDTELKVFVPWQYADMCWVAGVKFYPSLQPDEHRKAASVACALGLPIIAHCSPGGVRLPRMSVRDAKYQNAPERWLEIVRDMPIDLCLAHGGGSSWASNMISGKMERTWPLAYMMREACPPTDWAGRLWIDTAFHEDQDEPYYKRAVTLAGAPWRVLWGSDWPLHLPFWSYRKAAAWGRAYWGDQVAAQAEFTEVTP